MTDLYRSDNRNYTENASAFMLHPEYLNVET